MTPEQIRAEAIDRIARCMDYYVAEAAVEALGDLLPAGQALCARYEDPVTGTNRITLGNQGQADKIKQRTIWGQPVSIETQWTHDWQKAPDA